jgi:hypothetical protein
MLRREPIFVATEDALVASGIQKDRHDLKKALWESAENVVFAQGSIRRKLPPALAFNVDNAPIRGIGQQRATNGGRWLWAGANGKAWRWAFGAPELIKAGLTYQADQTVNALPTFYDFTFYGDWTIINDGVAPFIHKPPAAAAAWVGEVPQGAVRYLKKMNFMMALGYGLRGTRVGWSDADNIDAWTATAENLAGSLSIDDFDTPIRAGGFLADAISCYAEDQMALVRYIGGTLVFGQKLTVDGIGAVGKAAIASDTRYNVGVGRAGIWWTDGTSFRYIDEGYLSDYLQDEVNWNQAGKIVAARNDYTGTFEFHFPVRDSAVLNEGWSWDPRTGGFSPIPYAQFKDERKMFGAVVVGTVDGKLMLDDNDPALAGPLSLSTRPIMLGDTHLVSMVDEADFLFHEAQNVEYRMGSCENPSLVEDDWDWTQWEAVEPQRTTYNLQRLPEQPFFKLQFRSKPGQNDWRFNLQGFLLYGTVSGTAKKA